MFKKLLPFLIIVVFLVPTGLFWYLFKDKTIPDNRIDAIEAVPIDAIMVMETPSASNLIQLFNSQTQIQEDLALITSLQPFLSVVEQIDSLIIKDKVWADRLTMIPAVWSLHKTGDHQYQFVLVLQTNNRLAPKNILDLVQTVTGQAGNAIERQYNRSKIVEVNYPDGAINQLSMTLVKKYLVCSSSPILVEEVIRQVKDGNNLNQLAGFGMAGAVAGQTADANMYFNLTRFPEFISEVMHPAIASSIEAFSRYGSWLELDLSFREDLLMATGFGFSGDTLAWLDVFHGQTPQKSELDQVLPAHVLGFLSYGIEKPSTFLPDLDGMYKGSAVENSRINQYSQITRSLGADLRTTFADIIQQEVALAWLPGSNDEVYSVMVLGTPSRNLASQRLSEWVQSKARSENKRIQDYRRTYSFDNTNRHYIYRMPVEGIPEALFGKLFAGLKGKYYGFAGNNLILADNYKAIQDVIYFNALKKTLNTDLDYQGVINQIGTRSNFLFYLNPGKSQSFLKERLNQNWAKNVDTNTEFFKRIGGLSMQVQARNENFYHTAFMKFSESQTSHPQTVWDSRLDTTLNFKPVLTTNHNTKAKEIIVQDEAHNLYLINAMGTSLWKVRLNEAINSGVYQVDFYKNGKLQLLFSTKNALHLIDRNGNYVDKYPIRLRAPASNGMALFDYEKNRDYRIFIAGEDKQVYAYDKTGKIVEGWSFSGTEGTVNQPIQHYRIGTKDYIVFADQMRVYILDRRGNTRVNPDQQFAGSRNNPLVLDGQSPKGARLVTTDVNGKIWSVYFNGDVESIELDKFGPDHYFKLEDLNLDGRKDYIFADGKKLGVYQSDEKTIFEKTLKGNISHAPSIYRFPGNTKEIGIVCRELEEIHLFLPDGALHEGFPLRGRTQFTIGYLNRSSRQFNLLVGGDNLFLYNYSVK